MVVVVVVVMNKWVVEGVMVVVWEGVDVVSGEGVDVVSGELVDVGFGVGTRKIGARCCRFLSGGLRGSCVDNRSLAAF